MNEFTTTVVDLAELQRVDQRLNSMASQGWRLRFISEVRSPTDTSVKAWIVLWERQIPGSTAAW